MTQRSTTRRTRKSKIDKPKKPYKTFPLCPHSLGYWCKSIRGKIYYFGRWGRQVDGKMQRLAGDGWQEALEEFKRQRDDLYAGRQPQRDTGELLLVDLCDKFLVAKNKQVESGELSPRTFSDYKRATDRLIRVFGKSRAVDSLRPDDFAKLRDAMAKTYSPVALVAEITRTRAVFNYGEKNVLIEKRVRYGTAFDRPSRKTLRTHRAARGERMFEASEIRALIDGTRLQNDDGSEVVIAAASPLLRAMILLAINCGFGNSDCSRLPISAVNLETGWVVFPRPKTGINRRVPLWRETVAALRDSLAVRRHAASADEPVFLTPRGYRFTDFSHGEKQAWKDYISSLFSKRLSVLDMKRDRLNFYAIRHTFQTIGDTAKDPVAVSAIMGHVDSSMAGQYRERIGDDRLRAVVDHVRAWLFGKPIDESVPQPVDQPSLRIVG